MSPPARLQQLGEQPPPVQLGDPDGGVTRGGGDELVAMAVAPDCSSQRALPPGAAPIRRESSALISAEIASVKTSARYAANGESAAANDMESAFEADRGYGC